MVIMKLPSPRTLKLLLLAIIVFIVLALKDLLIEMVGGKIGDYLQKTFPFITTTRLVVFFIAILIVAFLYAIYEALQNKVENEELVAHIENIEPNIKKLIKSLKVRYQSRYEQKLDGRFEITLEVSEDFDGMNPRSFTEEFRINASAGEAIKVIGDAFEKKGRLLIIGNPGVGKSVLLLKLAIDLLSKDVLEKNEAFPVIFNLASWSEEYKNFSDWFKEILVSGNGLSKAFADVLLHQERIIFLLDGLDELAHNETEELASVKRAKCLASLNNHLQGGHRAVICCRAEEFEQMKKKTSQDAPVAAKVKVLELTKAQVLLALEQAKVDKAIKHHASANNLLKLFEKEGNDDLLEVLRTPFYFTTAMEIFDRQILAENNFPKTNDKLKQYMLERFVENKVKNTPNPTYYKPEKTIVWLSWLAQFLEKKYISSFELAHLQPTDLRNTWHFTFSYGLTYGLPIGLVFGWYFGLLAILFFGLLSHLRGIQTDDNRQWHLPQLSNRKNRIIIYKISLFSSLIGIIIGYLLDGLFVGLFIGLPLAFYISLLASLIALSQSFSQFAQIEHPYQRLRAGIISNSLQLIIIISPIVGLAFIMKESMTTRNILFYIGITLLGCTGTEFLRGPFYRHCILRLCLRYEGAMPLKYTTFLNYAVSLRILEKDCGQWRFRHQNLQDHFAKLCNETHSTQRNKHRFRFFTRPLPDTELYKAAERGETERVKELLSKGANPDEQNHSGWTPLMIAVAEQKVDTVKLLLENKSNPNLCNYKGRTPVMFASRYGNEAIVKILLEAGADPNFHMIGNADYCALGAAAVYGHKAIVELLLKAGADPNYKNMYGETPIALAVEAGHLEIASIIRESQRMSGEGNDGCQHK